MEIKGPSENRLRGFGTAEGIGAAPNMTPAEAERYLASLELFGMRFGLDRMRRLMTALGTPQRAYDTIQVVGTNGKSSTARMIAAIARAHGLRTGTYLSPHLTSFAERVEVAGRSISMQRLARALGHARHAAEIVERGLEPDDRVTQFEVLTAAALAELADARVELAVIEAGLGARYDATSVVSPKVVVLTNIGLEHTRWLGPSERHIAEEKLAVTPARGVLVSGPLGGEAYTVAQRAVVERDTQWVQVAELEPEFADIELSVLGDFQRDNFALAIAAVRAQLGGLDGDAVRAAGQQLVIPGRLERIAERPTVLIDGAHNPSGVRALVRSLPKVLREVRPLVALVSVLDDKDAATMLAELLPRCNSVLFTRSSHPRALSPAILDSLARQLGHSSAVIEPHPQDALERAIAQAGADGAVLVTGSIYLLSDLQRAQIGSARAEGRWAST